MSIALSDVMSVGRLLEKKHFDAVSRRGNPRLVASPDGRDGSVRIHQDACLYAALFDLA